MQAASAHRILLLPALLLLLAPAGHAEEVEVGEAEVLGSWGGGVAGVRPAAAMGGYWPRARALRRPSAPVVGLQRVRLLLQLLAVAGDHDANAGAAAPARAGAARLHAVLLPRRPAIATRRAAVVLRGQRRGGDGGQRRRRPCPRGGQLALPPPPRLDGCRAGASSHVLNSAAQDAILALYFEFAHCAGAMSVKRTSQLVRRPPTPARARRGGRPTQAGAGTGSGTHCTAAAGASGSPVARTWPSPGSTCPASAAGWWCAAGARPPGARSRAFAPRGSRSRTAA